MPIVPTLQTMSITFISHHVSKGSAMLFSRLFSLPSRITYSLLTIVLLIVVFLLQTAQAKDVTLPAYSANKHLGLISCSGSTCHGATKASGSSSVRQNEFFTWKRKDQHSKAYEHLKSDLSVRIAKNLGLKVKAHEAKVCLDCHTNNVAKDKQGKRFQISDGVTCEACHGGAGRKVGNTSGGTTDGWLGDHIAAKPGKEGHQQNITNGLYPTDNPAKRAKLCLSCHFGDDTKFVTHRIMGAGHPRMTFELDTYTATQPAHYQMDEDYRQRKNLTVADGTQIWAIGQAVAAGLFLDKLDAENLDKGKLFPELTLFDCQSCHHEMKNKRWTGHTGLTTGVVRLNDASLVLLRHASSLLKPNESKRFKQALLKLHQATVKNKQAIPAAIEDLRKMTRRFATEFASHTFTRAEKLSLLKAIIKEGSNGRHADYMVAEQSLMAIDAISHSMSLKLKLDRLYALFGDGEKSSPKYKDEDYPKYNVSAYRNGLKAIRLK